ncbi:hypothetical protein DM02DRAFT_608975 [Periconia macrospinosa]|uniref:Uncharacterized protein n=1 Tax=Periconia macrospinosa TaxID=97972 RepID=A0A2V1E9X7_9PLEO|nr:hypothetical protein DM02DRAFT_608975 [Periconia macrospinosa]
MAPPTDSLALRENNAPNLIARQSVVQSTSDLGGPLTTQVIEPRQIVVTGIIPTYYRIDGPSPGTVVGIVLGSVAGFILIVWLLYSITQGNTGRNGTSGAIAGEEEFVVRRPRRKSNSHAGRSRRSEVREYSRSPRQSGGRSTVIVEERRPPPRARSRSIVVESRRPGDDIVEVIEEHDDYRSRRGSRRSADYRY